MIAATLQEQKKSKIRFFAVYMASVALLLIIISSLWKNDASGPATNNIIASSPPESDNLLQADALLHTKLQALDSRYSVAIAAGKTGMQAERNNLQAAETDFKTTLDSLEKEAPAAKDEQQRNGLTLIVAGFRQSLQTRSSLINSYTALLNDTSRSVVNVQSPSATTDGDMRELKSILVEKEEKLATLEKQRVAGLQEKDKIIASLQSRVNNKTNIPAPVQTITTAGDSEWKQKYIKLKASFDNTANQNKSYKALVDDNRRLLSQLQAARKQ